MSYTDGLVGAYWFEEAPGASRQDASGAGNHLTEDNGDIDRSTTRKEGAYAAGSFDMNSYVSNLVRADASLSASFPGKDSTGFGAMTLGFWLYPSGVGTDQVLWKGAGKIEVWWTYGDPSQIFCHLGGKQISFDADADTWVHVAMRWDEASTDEFALIINGAKHGTTQTGVADFSNADQLVVGGFDSGASAPYEWNGYVDEMFAYDRDLSEAEVKAIYLYGLHDLIDGVRDDSVDRQAAVTVVTT